MSRTNSNTPNESYVTVHGRNVISSQGLSSSNNSHNDEILVPLTALNECGFDIFKSRDYNELFANRINFTKEFDLHMLEVAKKYLIKNEYVCTEDEIIEVINGVKQQLLQKVIERKLVSDEEHKMVTVNNNVTKNNEKREKAEDFIQSPDNSNNKKIQSPKKDCFDKSSALKLNSEYIVNISHVVNKTSMYVQIDNNKKILQNINDDLSKVKEHEMQNMKKGTINNIYMAKFNNAWLRCKLLCNRPLTVHFIDIGNTARVTSIEELPFNMRNIPPQAYKINFDITNFKPQEGDQILIEANNINMNGEYIAKIAKKISSGCKTYITTPKPLCSLSDKQTVIIIHEEGGILYLRTSKCCANLRNIEAEISELDLKKLDELQEEQLILCKTRDSNEFRRAIIMSIKGEIAQVEFVDYPQNEFIDKAMVRNITDSLSTKPASYFKTPKIINNSNKLCQDFIQNCIKSQKKFKVLINEENFDLLYLDDSNKETSLKQTLHSYVSKVSSKVYLNDLNVYKPKFGINTYMLSYYKKYDDFTLISADEINENIQKIVLTNVVDTNAYQPEVNEVCLGLYSSEWYRCCVTSKHNQSYKVWFFDFGNRDILTKEKLRQLPNECAQIAKLGICCKLTELPENCKEMESSITARFTEGEFYNINVKSINNGIYNVELPKDFFN